MPQVSLRAAPLVGGVSTQPPSNRRVDQLADADNCTMHINRGLEKRAGTEVILGEGSLGSLNVAGADSDAVFTHWINSEQDGRYLVLVDGSLPDANVIQVFDLDTGDKQGVTVQDAAALAYLRSGTGTSASKLRALTVANTTFLLNRQVVAALTGASPNHSVTKTVTALAIPPSTDSLGVGSIVNLITADVGFPPGLYQVVNATGTTGPWYSERLTTNLPNSLVNAATMPVRLNRNPDTGVFTLVLCQWSPRVSGDDSTNPGPSVIGKRISDIALFQDRLWLSAEDRIVSSQAGDYFNLWISDPAEIVDSDPIDVFLAGSAVHRVQFLVPFSRTMVVMADGSRQYELTSTGALSPSSVELVETTAYQSSGKARPEQVGDSLYFAADLGNSSQIWEYFFNYDRDSNIALDTTIAVSDYIPKNITEITANQNSRVIFVRSPSSPNEIYVSYYYWQVTQKVQEAWSRWTLDPSVTIRSIRSIDNYLYLLLSVGGRRYLERISVSVPTNDEGLDFSARMDRKLLSQGEYDPTTNRTTWLLPFNDPTIDTVVLAGGLTVAATNDSSGPLTALSSPTDLSQDPAWVGRSYRMAAVLSEQFVRDENDQVISGNLSIRTLDIRHKDTVGYEVETTVKGRMPSVFRYNAPTVGRAKVSRTNIDDFGVFRVLPRAKSDTLTMTIRHDGPTPVLISNIQITGEFQLDRLNPTTR